VARCESKNGHQKGIMVKKEIGQHAQNLLSILGSLVNIIFGGGGLFGPKIRIRNFRLVMNKFFFLFLENFRKSA